MNSILNNNDEQQTACEPESKLPDECSAPDEFYCPITLNIMVQPLCTKTGKNFERKAIMDWLSKNGTDPLTRNPMRPSDLIPNRALETRIRFWRKANNITEEEFIETKTEFVGFLPVTPKKHHQILHRSAARMTLQDAARANMRAVVVPPTISTTSRREPGERRRRFLSRLLNQATRELEDL
jgi:hypothetical protein